MMSGHVRLIAVAAVFALATTVLSADLINEKPFIPAALRETSKVFPTNNATRVQIIADRVEYLQDDLNGQFLVSFLGVVKPEGDAKQKIALSLKDADGKEVAAKTIAPVKSPKLPVLVAVSELKPGKYTLTAVLTSQDGTPPRDATATFTLSDRKEPHSAFPKDGVAIQAHPQGLVPNAEWPICTGVPMPNVTFKDISGFALLENGKPVPAQFSTRATWSPDGYVKWIGLDFVATFTRTPATRRMATASPTAIRALCFWGGCHISWMPSMRLGSNSSQPAM